MSSAIRLRAIAILICGCVVLALLWRGLEPGDRRSEEAGLAQAEMALRTGNFEQAIQAARDVLRHAPQSSAALSIAGQAAGKAGRSEEALRFFEQVPDDGSQASVEGICLRGEMLMFLSRFTEAEQQFLRALRQQPDSYFAHHRLAHLYAPTGQYWQAEPHLLWLIQSGKYTRHELELLGGLRISVAEESALREYAAAAPQDAALWLGLAIRFRESDEAVCQEYLRKAISLNPQLADAHAWLGWMLSHQQDGRAAIRWSVELPTIAEVHPMTWATRGYLAQQRQDSPAAIRCYWEAMRRDPNLSLANIHLGTLLEAAGRNDDARLFRERDQTLTDLGSVFDVLKKTDATSQTFHDVAAIMQKLGRFWEAAAWEKLALQSDPKNAEYRSSLEALEALRRDDPAKTAASHNPALLVDLSSFPLPDWRQEMAAAAPIEAVPADMAGGSRIKFEDVASQAGIEFVGYAGGSPDRVPRRFVEQIGGGVAALDADGDGWPDLYFSQGAPWPIDNQQTKYLDKLYRNRGDGQFQDCTELAGLGDGGFSQGVSAGDFDNDGFVDIYLGMLGQNRLYRNNGDGTFIDVTAEAGISGELWTSSCMMADLNGDGLPDLFDVNYVEGNLGRICDLHGVYGCAPEDFNPLPNVLYLNQGDGRFTDVSEAAGISQAVGKGLGVIAARFGETASLSVYVSNDGRPNFLFENQATEPGDTPRYVEQGFATGTAVDGDGKPQASMGIAAGDVDGDGWIDLFVTNFDFETNVLYLNIGQGQLFMDGSVPAGIREFSLRMLGWGTQFVDADLDGWPDLLVTNGHVDDFTKEGTDFAMRPQFLRNLGGARFAELPAASLGSFFAGKYHGRAMARLDANRDGREDVAIWHIDQPAALLLNRSSATGHSLTVQLRGVASSRDCIGAVVTARVGDRMQTRQLVGGDGFQCTNQRQLVFGLGPHETVEELSIQWPAGKKQTFHNVPGDVELIFVEGSPEFLRMR
ncbi:MAG: FG-GAP-like repeat-containing protein [Pirellulales bacterium]